jgi:putative SOS response-associated peptidase YedK
MCGRYYRQSDKQRVAEAFHIGNDISSLAMPPDDYNIAPSTFQPVIRESTDQEARGGSCAESSWIDKPPWIRCSK